MAKPSRGSLCNALVICAKSRWCVGVRSRLLSRSSPFGCSPDAVIFRWVSITESAYQQSLSVDKRNGGHQYRGQDYHWDKVPEKA